MSKNKIHPLSTLDRLHAVDFKSINEIELRNESLDIAKLINLLNKIAKSEQNNLASFVLSDCNFTNQNLPTRHDLAVEKILSALQRPNFSHLENLSLPNNAIARLTQGVEILKNILRNNRGLENLQLSNNGLNDNHLADICQELSMSPRKMIYLDFAQNNLSNNSAQFIASLLRLRSFEVTALNLKNNPNITDYGAQLLAESLAEKTSVKNINLAETNIRNLGADYFIRLLERNNAITSLTLPQNIGHKKREKINELLARNIKIDEKLDEEQQALANNNDKIIGVIPPPQETKINEKENFIKIAPECFRDIIDELNKAQEEIKKISEQNQQLHQSNLHEKEEAEKRLKEYEERLLNLTNKTEESLSKIMKSSEKNNAETLKILDDEVLTEFYYKLRQKLNFVFLIAPIISLGEFSKPDCLAVDVLNRIEGISTPIPLFGFIISQISSLVGQIDEFNWKGKFTKIASIIPSGDQLDVANFVEQVAREITINHQNEIRQNYALSAAEHNSDSILSRLFNGVKNYLDPSDNISVGAFGASLSKTELMADVCADRIVETINGMNEAKISSIKTAIMRAGGADEKELRTHEFIEEISKSIAQKSRQFGSEGQNNRPSSSTSSRQINQPPEQLVRVKESGCLIA